MGICLSQLTLRIVGGVLQKLLDSPLLINGRRFSLRMYVGHTGNEPFELFLCQTSFLILQAGNAESSNSAQIISNMHYHHEKSFMRVPTFLQYLREHDMLQKWWEQTLPQIGMGLKEFLRFDAVGEHPGIQSFGIFGCDILLDEALEPYLLECNRCPGMASNLKDHSTIFAELLYIILYKYQTQSLPHDIHHWKAL